LLPGGRAHLTGAVRKIAQLAPKLLRDSRNRPANV
jgi:hypothetical protein